MSYWFATGSMENVRRSAPAAKRTLQRKCDECHKKKPEPQTSAFVSSSRSMPPIVHEMLPSGIQVDPATQTFKDSNFAYDFSHISAHSRPSANIQAKHAINTSGDVNEQEADRVADQVALTESSRPIVSGVPPRIQRFSGNLTGQIDIAPTSVDHALASPSRPLDPGLRQDMGRRFGYDFSHVRVHSGADAARSARDVSANAYTVGQDVVFGEGQFSPEMKEGRWLIAHELTHVVQQSGVDGIRPGQRHGKGGLAPYLSHISLQRQKKGEDKAQPTPNMMRIYSFGPTGAGRVQMDSEMTIFSPAAPVDAKGYELVRAGTPAQPKISRFGRYFTLDERHRPYPQPVPSCGVRFITEWNPDDGSAPSKDQKEDNSTDYYAPGEPLGTKLGLEYLFPNDRPGVLTLVYVFSHPSLPILILSHGVHFVNDSTAPLGASVHDEGTKSQKSAQAALPEAKAATYEPAKADVSPKKEPEAKRTPLPPSPPAQKATAAEVGRIKELTELIKKVSDAAKRDPLVRELRDLLSKIQPVMPTKDAKKMIDDAIEPLVKEGLDAGIKAILEAVVGKSPSTMPDDRSRSQIGPALPERDLGVHIFQGPKIPIKDAPAPSHRFSFEYRNVLRKSYEPGGIIKFTLIPPDNFSMMQGNKHLVIVAEADRNSPNPDRLARIRLESASPTPIEMQAPQKPGKYVIRVDIGLGFDYSSVQEFEVKASQKQQGSSPGKP